MRTIYHSHFKVSNGATLLFQGTDLTTGSLLLSKHAGAQHKLTSYVTDAGSVKLALHLRHCFYQAFSKASSYDKKKASGGTR